METARATKPLAGHRLCVIGDRYLHMPAGTMPRQRIYWHRDLPPVKAQPMGGHTLEAVSARVSGTLEHRNDLWTRCYHDLMAEATRRLEQEIVRLHGDGAHVVAEHIEPRRDERTGEAWMYGRFDFELYRLA